MSQPTSPLPPVPGNETSPTQHPFTSHFDLSLVLIWFLAVVTLVIGSYWSGRVRYDLYLKNRSRGAEDSSEDGDDTDAGGKKRKRRKKRQEEEEQFLNISPIYVLCFVAAMGCMLLALYYFFNYLVFVIIALFVMASILSSFVCLSPVVKALLPSSLTSIRIPNRSSPNSVPAYQILVLLMSASLSITWLVFRKRSFAWMLQDILGVFFSINMLRTIRLPSFKICTILLSLLFLYDIFFVFLTPFLTPSGKSVMVEVATGGSQGDETGVPGDGTGTQRETLPMVLVVPHFTFGGSSNNSTDPSAGRSSLLGFGDILVPGLLVSYCHAFDLIQQIRFPVYFVTGCVAYGLGLIITFIGLFLMSGTAQPALLYLVPCNLITPIAISLYRREFRLLWEGPGDGTPEQVPKSKAASNSTNLLSNEQSNSTPEAGNDLLPVPSSV